MIRLFAGALVLASLAAAPAATADPEILVPGCGSGQVAEPGACTPEPAEELADELAVGPLGGTPGAFPGANPNIPPGPLPLDFPVVLPLGVTPFQVPPNLPLGPTPPRGFPFAT